MRHFMAAALAISMFSLPRVHAEPPPAQAEAPAGGVPEPVVAPAPAPAPAPVVAPAPAPVVTPPVEPAPALAPASARENGDALRASLGAELANADAWVAFEANRDKHTRTAEKVFFPLALGLETGIAAAFAATVTDATDTSRIVAGVTAGVTLAAIVPTLLSKTRSGRRAWFAAGAAAFSVGAGAALITSEGKGESDHSARWGGASLALQGLLMLPVGFIPGFPEESEYEAYRLLPESERPAAAARLLARVDRFEQRAAALALFSTIASAVVLGVGAAVSDDRDQARTLGGLTLVPVVTSLVAFVPRLFVRSRLDRFSFGEAPRKLPLNGW